jgi:transposase
MEKNFVSAKELSKILGVSVSKSYTIIRSLNNELSENGYMVIAGKCPKKFVEKKFYGFGKASI